MLNNVFERFEGTEAKAGISMTPLIDMVFILLIFFVVATSFTKETGIKVNKATASTAQAVQKDLLLIALDKEGQYWYDKQNMNIDEVVARVLQAEKAMEDLNVVMIPDKDCRVAPLIALMDALRQNNITSFTVGTRQEHPLQPLIPDTMEGER